MNEVLQQVVVLVLMMAVGFLVGRVKMIRSEGRDVLTKVVLNIASPALVINSFQVEFNAQLLRDMALIAVFATVSMALFFVLGKYMWPKGDDEKRRVLWQATMFSNCGFMGYPVLYSLFGDTGVMYGAVYVMVFVVYSWTLGIHIYAGKTGGWKDILLQPGLIAVFVGLAFFLLRVHLPGPIVQTVKGIGALNTPLAMLIVGLLVAEGDFKSLFREHTLFTGAAVRLIALPAVSLGVLWLLWQLGVPGMQAVASPAVRSCVLLTAMPIAANVAIFAAMYNIKPQFAAQTVLVSTLFSVATVPLWMVAMQAVARLGG